MWLFKKTTVSSEQALLKVPKSPHPFRGWTNFGTFSVQGINPKTGRSNKKQVEALDDADARNKAVSIGLSEPITVSEVQRNMITDAQKNYLRNLGIKFTGNETMEDASALICMVNDGETPSERISNEQWKAACDAGVCVSAFSCQKLYKSIMENKK